MGRRQRAHTLKEARRRQRGAARCLHDDAGDLAPVALELLLERGQIVVAERQRGAGQAVRHALRLDPRQQVRVEHAFVLQIGGKVPVVPAVIAAEQHLLAAGIAPRDTHRNCVRLAAPLTVAHHLGAGDRVDQFAR